MILGLIIVILIAKHFYDFAKYYQKNKLLYTFLSIATFYLGTFLFGIIYSYLRTANGTINTTAINVQFSILFSLIAGLLLCSILWQLLRMKWKSEKNDNEINELGSDI